MRYRRLVRGRGGPFAIEVVLDDGVDGRIGPRADIEGAGAGRFKPVRTMRFGQTDNPDAGSKTLFGVRALSQNNLNERRRAGADLASLPLEAFRRPVGVAPMRTGHVLAHRCVAAIG